MKVGTVLKFNSHAYGFILESGDARKEYFFHISAVAGRKSLKPGDLVRFEAGPENGTAKAPPAVRVELIEPSKSAVLR